MGKHAHQQIEGQEEVDVHNGNSTPRERIVKPSQQPQNCACCEIEFFWPPVVVGDVIYCCTGCAAGGPCNCDYSQYRSINISGVIHYTTNNSEASASKHDSIPETDR